MKRTMLAFSAMAMAHILMSEAGEGGEGAAGTEAPKGAAIRPDLTSYQTAKSASGSTTKHSGDAVALALVGATLDETYAFVSKVVGIEEQVLRDKYSASNVGQQRMFLGNLIRGGMNGKDAAKAERIETAFSENLAEFRVAIDKRQVTAAAALAEEKAKKEADKQKIKDDLKAERDAKAKAAADKKAADAEAKKSAAADPKPAKAPKEPAQPK